MLNTGVENTRLKKQSSRAECWALYTSAAALKNHLVLSVGAKFTVGNLKSPLMLSATAQYMPVYDQKLPLVLGAGSRNTRQQKNHVVLSVWPCTRWLSSRAQKWCKYTVDSRKPFLAQCLTPSNITWSGYQSTRKVLCRIKDVISSTLTDFFFGKLHCQRRSHEA